MFLGSWEAEVRTDDQLHIALLGLKRGFIFDSKFLKEVIFPLCLTLKWWVQYWSLQYERDVGILECVQ